jgi:aspartyl-tRNA(Asn)/glutamyl-tRNA(Gln) amidotransferase subunit A
MMRRRIALTAAMDERLTLVDVLALPTTAWAAPPIAPLLTDDALYYRTNLLLSRNTLIGNQFDLTSISLPIDGAPRPVGLMLLARHGQDRMLLEISSSIEELADTLPVRQQTE